MENLITGEARDKLVRMLHGYLIDTDRIKRCFLNVPYGEGSGEKMNIYLPPDGDGPFPVILFLHGGGWQGGGRGDSQVLPFLPGIERGYAVISCDYGLLPKVGYPENLFDVKAALKFIYDNADRFLLDNNRIALAGASAGAQLALMAAFTENKSGFDGGFSSPVKIKAVVDQFGPTDFENEDKHYEITGYPRFAPPHKKGEGTPSKLLRADTDEDPELLKTLSPIANVHKEIPPVLILHGKYDPMVSYLQSTELAEKITEVCGEEKVRLVISEDTTHADVKYESEPYTSIIFKFFDDYLK